MLIFSLIFEVLKLNQDLLTDICPRSQRIKSKIYSLFSDDSARGYNVQDFTFPANAIENCTYPKTFPLTLEKDLLEELNDIRYLHGMGAWPVELSDLELHREMVTEGIWFWHDNTNSPLVSDHRTQSGSKCSKELPHGAMGFGFSSQSGTSGYLKAGYMLWILIDETIE
ncbi:hypothetical protein TVAG_061680 [Trichomonas vaginalis G3]|uniref:Uncharacterized protein n=1 Tax=Trichomonas vaginalis (strain ATCC PRA-98 / G3) TaxID=412133 RepID=A2E7T3_TRIV3|nr:hypothetical protein TVAGG3_0239520 [Trichomonas vaginalis G3]EAY11264.1 hypothetical protein TVAG_061680 [Trichomonas vaginalis G3]KAI5553217.1 hypothetical protein TVAGG3_0239520 [Trichomonas vaginalis G3]|eukprot:XP_001323487.1 hypothetical protein [Trichomonas vaginalis G3]